MIEVVDILSLPQFNSFRIVTNEEGLQNIVCGTGIWEWESSEEINETFKQGEFVFTTLNATRNNNEKAIEGLRALIRKRVSAIAIKAIYCDTCPKEVIDLANKYRVPIFFFKELYIDDLIYIIRNAVIHDDSNDIKLSLLKTIRNCHNVEQILKGIKKLNPLFYENLVCFCFLTKENKSSEFLDNIYYKYRHSLMADKVGPVDKYVFIRCSKCVIAIYTAEKEIEDTKQLIENVFSRLNLKINDYYIGISENKDELSSINDAIDEAISAALSCFLDYIPIKYYCDIGADMFLLPNISNKYYLDFYNRSFKLLSSYDDTHGANLIKTLRVYVESEGDITLTAKRLFQHDNTIRYRIDKIKKMLNTVTSIDANMQFYVFVKMHMLQLENLLYRETII